MQSLRRVSTLPIPYALRLRSFDVTPDRYVIRVKHEVDVSLRAGVKACEPPDQAGAPNITAQLVVRVVMDSY